MASIRIGRKLQSHLEDVRLLVDISLTMVEALRKKNGGIVA